MTQWLKALVTRFGKLNPISRSDTIKERTNSCKLPSIDFYTYANTHPNMHARTGASTCRHLGANCPSTQGDCSEPMRRV